MGLAQKIRRTTRKGGGGGQRWGRGFNKDFHGDRVVVGLEYPGMIGSPRNRLSVFPSFGEPKGGGMVCHRREEKGRQGLLLHRKGLGRWII